MTNTSQETKEYTAQQAVPTISTIDRNIIRNKLGTVRQELDATMKMIDNSTKPLRKEQLEQLLLRWHELLISALNTRK